MPCFSAARHALIPAVWVVVCLHVCAEDMYVSFATRQLDFCPQYSLCAPCVCCRLQGYASGVVR